MISSGYNKPVKIIWLIVPELQAGPELPWLLSSPGQQIIKINNLRGEVEGWEDWRKKPREERMHLIRTNPSAQAKQLNDYH